VRRGTLAVRREIPNRKFKRKVNSDRRGKSVLELGGGVERGLTGSEKNVPWGRRELIGLSEKEGKKVTSTGGGKTPGVLEKIRRIHFTDKRRGVWKSQPSW